MRKYNIKTIISDYYILKKKIILIKKRRLHITQTIKIFDWLFTNVFFVTRNILPPVNDLNLSTPKNTQKTSAVYFKLEDLRY